MPYDMVYSLVLESVWQERGGLGRVGNPGQRQRRAFLDSPETFSGPPYGHDNSLCIL